MPSIDLSGIDPFQRIQTGWRMQHAYPTREDGLCSCGCGRKLTGRRTRWATTECGEMAYQVYAIHAGQANSIRHALYERDGGTCAQCGTECGVRLQGPQPLRLRFTVLRSPDWDADHITPVCEGGGGCGLDGYQTLCVNCHKEKTVAMNKRRAAERREDPEQVDLGAA